MEKNPKAVSLDDVMRENDESHERHEKEIEALDNRHLASKSKDTKDKPLCSRCGGLLHGKTHGYCEECKALRDAGEIKPQHRAEPDYAQRKCACGNWFEPTTARGSKCKSCKDKKGEPMARRRYSIQAKKLFVEKTNEFREKGMSISDAVKKAGGIALGGGGTDFSYHEWSKKLEITYEGKASKQAKPAPEKAYGRSKHTLEERRAFVTKVNAAMENGKTKGVACAEVGKEMFGEEKSIHNYRDFSIALGLIKKNASPRRGQGRQRSPFTEDQRRRFVAMVEDMKSRDIPTEVAALKAGREVLGVEVSAKKFQNIKSALKAKDEKANGMAEQKAKAKLAATLNLGTVITWLNSLDAIEDADTLIDLQDALDARKVAVHEVMDAQATMLLEKLERLKAPKRKVEPEVTQTETPDDVSTGQQEGADSGERPDPLAQVV